ncbi:peptidoglycan -binding protein [Terrirubrum flagellatum]|uniref:peptidoglycan -binding protein n=1 Tax=Terrirubrum flagellatum TaxID=2895980 RepID=UPI003CC819A0
MMASASRRRSGGMDYWPGFVDALSTLLLAIIFVLSVFVMGQFLLSQEIAGRDTALQRLQRQLSELTDMLALERAGKKSLEDSLGLANITLNAADVARKRLEEQLATGGDAAAAANTAQRALLDEKQITQRALAQIETLNQQMAALRRQISALEEALGASENKEKESQTRIADLGLRLNVALAQRVQELTRYRSEFFGRMREIIGARPDIRVVGDRFVFQSEVFFDLGQAQLKQAGMPELDKLASTIADLAREIPPDVNWILRVDGHTDSRPLSGTGQFKSNWDLSTARAVSVVQYLVSKGIPANHIAATGFGEFQPLELGTDDDSNRRNRRIEFKLTER